MSQPSQNAHPWNFLRQMTPARVALGRAGGSLPTAEVLSFAAAHAQARDAVWAELDVEALSRDLGSLGLPVVKLASAAQDRRRYLLRPDQGRRLDDPSRATLGSVTGDARGRDLCVIVSDGLSALAARRQALPLLRELLPRLQESQISVAPLCVVRLGRVAVEDEIGQALRVKTALVLLGERPGLGSPDSLGAYLVFDPVAGARTDADRNCVSNIRPEGLAFVPAAATLHYLITESIRRRLSGVGLKDERALPAAEGASPPPPRHLP
jgi:ethanolamine ammonia-lyase small subunit